MAAEGIPKPQGIHARAHRTWLKVPKWIGGQSLAGVWIDAQHLAIVLVDINRAHFQIIGPVQGIVADADKQFIWAAKPKKAGGVGDGRNRDIAENAITKTWIAGRDALQREVALGQHIRLLPRLVAHVEDIKIFAIG